MKPLAAEREVKERVRHILDAPSLNVTRDEIREMAEKVIASLRGDMSVAHIQLYDELSGLAKFIETARREISLIQPTDISKTHIPNATDELGAIVGATEEATGTILDSCEKIEKLAPNMSDETAQKMLALVTKIYEACNFQDLTGQRISKVVHTLDIIDKRVADLLAAFSDKDNKFVLADTKPKAENKPSNIAPAQMSESDLLHGPQLPEEAKRQAEIDAILASFN
ncbi:MAG: protein phosphatase CheZ [Alphaproteobacteria bacterium]|nr:protein phosphatase CheZ [Alphaproteobacteria bacterium]